MDRQWQRRAKGRYVSLQPLDEFMAQLPPLPPPSSVSSADGVASLVASWACLSAPADLYGVFSVLHAQVRPQPQNAAPPAPTPPSITPPP